MNTYKIGRYACTSGTRTCLFTGEKHVDIAQALDDERFADMQVLLDDWFSMEPKLSALVANPGDLVAINGDVALLAPLVPKTIMCVGANYRDHLLEMLAARGVHPKNWQRDPEAKPWFFLKSAACIANPGQDIMIPSFDWNIDWEVELAAVVGAPIRNATLETALDRIAGYTAANYLSARGKLRRDDVAQGSPFIFDWVGHKVFDGSCPIGPWIVPSSQVEDPQDIELELSVNGEIMQRSNTSEMIFSLSEQIVEISGSLTLHPGDLILTGTPAGVGSANGRFLKNGDVTEATVSGVGTLVNRLTRFPCE